MVSDWHVPTKPSAVLVSLEIIVTNLAGAQTHRALSLSLSLSLLMGNMCDKFNLQTARARTLFLETSYREVRA